MKMQWKTAVAVTAAVSYLSLATVSHGVFLKKPGDLVGTSTKVQPNLVVENDPPLEPQITVAATLLMVGLAMYWSWVYGPPIHPQNNKGPVEKSPEKMLEALP